MEDDLSIWPAMGYTLLVVATVFLYSMNDALAALIIFQAIRTSQWMDLKTGVAVSASQDSDVDAEKIITFACVVNTYFMLLFSLMRLGGAFPMSVPTLVCASMLFWIALSAGFITLKATFTAADSDARRVREGRWVGVKLKADRQC